jgi:hypothetical protein
MVTNLQGAGQVAGLPLGEASRSGVSSDEPFIVPRRQTGQERKSKV